MLKLRSILRHRSARTNSGCVPTCVATIFQISEEDARKVCKTDSSGSNMHVTAAGLQKLGVPCHLVQVEEDFDLCKWWLESLSQHYPLIVSGNWKHKVYRKGAPRDLHHAVVISDGLAYDPAMGEENGAVCLDALRGEMDKAFTIKQVLVIDLERPSYGQPEAKAAEHFE